MVVHSAAQAASAEVGAEDVEGHQDHDRAGRRPSRIDQVSLSFEAQRGERDGARASSHSARVLAWRCASQ